MTLQKEIDESDTISMSLVGWTTSAQCEEIRELKKNDVTMQGFHNETENALSKVTQGLDFRESPSKCRSKLRDRKSYWKKR